MKLQDALPWVGIGLVVLHALFFRDGNFTPSSLALIGMLLGSIPATAADRRAKRKRQAQDQETEEALAQGDLPEQARKVLQKYLER